MKAQQIKFKMQNVALMEEWAIINGNSTLGAGLQFDGFRRLITTNVTDNASTAISLNALTTTMRNIYDRGGKPQFVVLALRDHQKISELVLSSYYRLFQNGNGALADIPAGVAVTRWVSPFGTVDLIGSRYVCEAYGLTDAYIIDDVSMTNDGNAVAMVDLMPISSIELALTASAYKTLIAEFTVLMMTIEVFQGRIKNISA